MNIFSGTFQGMWAVDGILWLSFPRPYSQSQSTALIPGEYNQGQGVPTRSFLSHGYPGTVSHCSREILIPRCSARTFHTMIKPQGNRAVIFG